MTIIKSRILRLLPASRVDFSAEAFLRVSLAAAAAATAVADIAANEEKVPMEPEEEEPVGERQSRAVVRSNSFKRRDSSWDKKWQEHIEKNLEDIPRSSVFARSPRVPGKVNRSIWETRLAQEAEEVARQKPRTPPPIVHRPTKPRSEAAPSPKPHFGAALSDYSDQSPSRTATPPYPTATNAEVNSTQEELATPDMPPPPVPCRLEELSEDCPLPPPPPDVPDVEEEEDKCDWKNEMREEILRARQNLISGQDSARVESVIRLLEQTYERLKCDTEEGATELYESPKEDRKSNEVPEMQQMECLMDDDEDLEPDEDEADNEPNALSRSISGTFHAMPATVVEDQGGQTDKLSQERRDFCKSMLLESQAAAMKTIDQTKKNKEDLMAEIRRQVQQVPAVDEVFQCNGEKPQNVARTPVVLTDTMIDEPLEIHTETKQLHVEELIQTAKVESCTQREVESSSVSMETPKVKEIQSEQIEEVISPPPPSQKMRSRSIDEPPVFQPSNQAIPSFKSQTLPRSSSTNYQDIAQEPRAKLKMFEASQRQKVFSISGLWSNVSLGLVKERSNFWQKNEDQPLRAKKANHFARGAPKENKRNSRIIDPNEWVCPGEDEFGGQGSESEKLPPPPPVSNGKHLHKSLSVGRLDVDDEETSDIRLISQATVAFETRANGRKSADIFMQKSKEASEETIVQESFSVAQETKCEQSQKLEVAQEMTGLIESTEVKVFETRKTMACESTQEESIMTETTQTVHCEQKESEHSMELTHCSTPLVSAEKVQVFEAPPVMTSSPSPSLSERKPSMSPCLTHDSGLPPPAPQVPNRHSSKHVIKQKMQVGKKPSVPSAPSSSPQMMKPPAPMVTTPPKPMLNIVSIETSRVDENRLKALSDFEEGRRRQEEEEKRAKLLQEQEQKFYQKFEFSQSYRKQQLVSSSKMNAEQEAPLPPPPPKVDYERPRLEQQRLEKLKAQELKERMKLREMERRKRQIEEEIAREKQHLANLLQMETARLTLSPIMTSKSVEEPTSPLPPPVPPRPVGQPPPRQPSMAMNGEHRISLEDTVRDLEETTQELKTMAEKRSADNDEAIRQTAGAVREVAQVLLDAVSSDKSAHETKEEENDDDTDGYSEGAEDFSCGIEMPLSVAGVVSGVEQNSGNVTPIPTQGELEDISTEEYQPSPRRTPLKSLLKRSVDPEEMTPVPPFEEPLISSVRERSCSPRKAVHFSNVDQVKLMSQESLVSTAPSDGSSNVEAHTVNATQVTCCSRQEPSMSEATTTMTTPRRNQHV